VKKLTKRKKVRGIIETAEEKERMLGLAYEFFGENTGNVEVVFHNNNLVKFYFPLPAEAH
jgi:hypothetical protein